LASECAVRFHFIASPDSGWNFGAAQFLPDVASVVPKTSLITVELRDMSAEVIEWMGQTLRELVKECSEKRGISAETIFKVVLTGDNGFGSSYRDYPRRGQTRRSCTEMPSGAIHDTKVLLEYVPTAMMVVPSMHGRSHIPVEDTKVRHIALGAEVFSESNARNVAPVVEYALPNKADAGIEGNKAT
jgi:N-carbamoyl-L-amino-acid hydrolase